MYFIVGKIINQDKQIISYLITDGNGVQEVSPLQVYTEYLSDNLPYLKGFNNTTGEVDFKNIDNSLLPTFYNGRGINNNVSVLQILTDKGRQIGVRLLLPSTKITNIRLSELLRYVNNNTIQLFNAKVVNNKVVMKIASDKEDTDNGVVNNASEKYAKNDDVKSIRLDENTRVKDAYGNEFEIKNRELVGCLMKDRIAIIPNGVTSIGKGAFMGCDEPIIITIPDSVTYIGSYTFYNCKELTDITIPNSVKIIGDCAFCDCIRLTSITIPYGVEVIGNEAFAGCTHLTSITLPNSMKTIDEGAFVECTELTSITLPNSITKIEHSIFAYCTGLTSIRIPNGVKSIGERAFEGCTGLKSITIPASVTTIEDKVFEGCTNISIKGVHGSVAEEYARVNNIKFVAIN